MRRYILGRIVILVPTLLAASIAIFLLMRLAIGGDPVLYVMEREYTVTQGEALRRELQLDRPLMVQYGTWLMRVAVGDFGRSFQSPMEVRYLLLARLPATLELAVMGGALALLIAVPAGIYMAVSSTKMERVASTMTIAALCIPDFCLGIILIYIFSVMLRWLPSSGYVPLRYGLRENLAGMILPAISLATWYAAAWTRYVRAAFLEVLEADYVRTARAKGLAERAVSYKHVLRNAIIPTVTIVGQNVAGMFGGVVVVETVFSNPGIGRLFGTAVLGRDYPVVQGVVVVMALVVSLSSLVVDLVYCLVDPRIRYQ